MTFREFECALGWEIAGRYNQQIHSALLRPPIALWREHEASLALRMPKDRMAFWVSFLPDAHRTLRPDGIWLHEIPYWSNALSWQVGRAKRELLVKFDPRDVSRIFVQHPDGRFIEARARALGFPAISLREWKQARKELGVKGRGERNDEQIIKTALAQRKLIDEAIAKTAAARRMPDKTKNTGDVADFGSMTGIDSRIPTVLELMERQRDRKPDHLTDEAGAVLTESIDERVYFVRSKRWIAYPKAVEILGHLNALLKHPRTTRMPSLAVYGDSGMGKSMLVEKFKDDYALSANDRPRGPKTKLLVVELAGRPNERRLYAQILAVVGAPQNPRATIVELERTAVRLLGDLGVQVLVLDEIHNVLAASWREQRVVFNTLRYLSNELKLSLVCFGIMEARQAINGDVQLARRFDAVSLPRWTAGKEFEQLVLAIVRNLPLREPSVLTVKGLRRILQTSGGVSARIFRMLNEVAIEAIETGAERVTDEALERYKPVGEDEAAFQ